MIEKTCEWEIITPYDYKTECENIFVMESGDLFMNDFKFCPYCGGKIVELKE